MNWKRHLPAGPYTDLRYCPWCGSSARTLLSGRCSACDWLPPGGTCDARRRATWGDEFIDQYVQKREAT